MPLGLLIRRSLDTTPKIGDSGFSRIRCPACGWQPGKSDRWVCGPGCGHVWNTFETRGICPACEKKWLLTACLQCGVWSPHDDWYEPAPGKD